MKMTFDRKIIIGFIACACILLSVAMYTYKNSEKFIASNELVDHTNQVLHGFEQILISTIEAETGTRGFVISGNKDFLDHFTNAQKQAFDRLNNLKELTRSDHNQQNNIKVLQIELKKRFDNLDIAITIGKKDLRKAVEFVSTENGKQIQDEIRKTIDSAQKIEYTLLAERKQTSNNDVHRFNLVSALLFLIIVMILLLVYFIITAYSKALKRAEAQARILVEDMPVGVILYGPESEILMRNPKAIEMLGLSEYHRLQKNAIEPDWKRIHADGSIFNKEDNPVSQAFATLQPVRDKTVGVCHPVTNEILWFMVHAVPRLYKNGTIRNVICTIVDITSRKKAEEELRESEQRLKFHFENSPLAIIERDKDFEVTQWSKEAEHIFGWNKEETVGKRINTLNLIHEEDVQLVNNIMERLSSGKEGTVVSTNRNVTKTGKIIDCVWHNSISYSQSGQIVSVMSLVQDVSLRKKAEESLMQLNEELEYRVRERTEDLLKLNEDLKVNEEKFRTVADFASNWEFWVDRKDTMFYCSPSCLRITGYNVIEFEQNPGLLYEIIHPDDLHIFQDHKKKEQQSHACDHEIQYRIIRKDGTVRWMGHFCQPVFDANGNNMGIRGSNRDINARKKTEGLLTTSNQKYKLLSENITDGIFICKHGKFEYINKAIYDIFGYDGRELEKMKLTQLVVQDRHEELENILYTHASVNRSCNLEVECLKKDFSIVYIEILLNYVCDDQIVYGVIHNITDKKHLQKNILKAIIQTEEKERAHFSKELHDGLGPLLSTIKLYLQWSERPNASLSREEIISKAGEILEEALTTVKEVSNKLSPHLLTNYGLNSAIRSFVEKLNATASFNIVFESNTERRIDGHIEVALYRAVIECINNTIKYSKANNIYIQLEDSGTQFQLQYKDDGNGFDLKETLSQKKGLGLFNLQNRLQTIGGKVVLKSEPGKGVDYMFTVKV